jgi:hypothetical protein
MIIFQMVMSFWVATAEKSSWELTSIGINYRKGGEVDK